jgi:hypothetical protein
MLLRIVLLLVAAVALTGCFESGPKRYIKIGGGGLTFNYRYSQATIVLVAQPVSPMPAGSQIQALFDIPGESQRQLVSRQVVEGQLSYKMESKYLTGIKKGVPLKVTLIALDPTGKELDRQETQFTSDMDQEGLPTKPLIDPSKPNYIPHLENN